MLTFPTTFMSQDDGFLPTDVPDLSLWLDAADASTITSSSNLISSWLDKSGNNRHAAQSSDTYKPVLASDSVGNYLNFPQNGISLGRHLDTPNFTGARTTFFVGDLDQSFQGISGVWGRNTANGTRSYIFLVNQSNSGFTYGVSLDGASSGDAGDWHVNSEFIANGGNIGLPTDTPAGTVLHRFTLNAGDPSTQVGLIGAINNSGQRSFVGRFRELLCFDGVPSAADTLAIETYLANKWGITLV